MKFNKYLEEFATIVVGGLSSKDLREKASNDAELNARQRGAIMGRCEHFQKGTPFLYLKKQI